MENEVKQYGYLPDEIKDEDYILGGLNLPTDILQENGQWDDFLPLVEIQRNEKFETYNCTAFGTLNCLEILFKRLFGETKNWSERYVGVAAGTRPPGNSPQKVIETIRKDCGLLDDDILPMSKADTVEEYYSPDPLPWLMKENGRKFLNNYSVKHEWAFSDTQRFNKAEIVKNALKYSPLGVAVFSWQFDFDKKVYIRPMGAEDNHWICVYGYEEGKFWKCYDSYDDTTKELDWDFGFERVKRFHLEKITYRPWYQFIINWAKELFK